jgi:hypothetical protein
VAEYEVLALGNDWPDIAMTQAVLLVFYANTENLAILRGVAAFMYLVTYEASFVKLVPLI